jgi:predicted aspartyl protease
MCGATTEEERQGYLSQALLDFDARIIPPLNRLFEEQGEGGPELIVARRAALDLVTFVCIEFIHKSTTYRWGVSSLMEMSENCQEPQLKRKLLIYTKQLTQRWNEADPGGDVFSAPVGQGKSESEEKNPVGQLLLLTTFLGTFLYSVYQFDLTGLVFPNWNNPTPTTPQARDLKTNDGSITPRVIRENSSSQELPSTQPENRGDAFYSFTDKLGVIHMVDDLDKVPQEYRATMKKKRIASGNGAVTPIVIRDNQVMVPVRLSFRGHTVETLLLLDTGASITTINGRLATQLGIDPTDTQPEGSIVADGRSIASYTCTVDLLAVGNRSLSKAMVSILPTSGGVGFDGLLGMNFLKKFHYHVDFDRSVIQWGG